MKAFGFEIEDEDSLVIVVDAEIHGDRYSIAFDTGASNTIIDLASLIILGYDEKDAVRTVEFETAKGPLSAYVFVIKEFTALGITRRNIEVCSYDFFNNNIFSDLHGVLGLDFIRDCTVCIDMVQRQLTVSQLGN